MDNKELPGTLPADFTDEGYARFEADWLARKSGEPPPRWQDYLPAAAAPCSPGLIRMLLQVDIEFRVKAGLPALLAERYFEHPRLQQKDALLDAAQQLELIQWEYQQRWQQGQPARRAEYEDAFPQHAAAVRELKPLWCCPKCQQKITLDESSQTLLCPSCGGEPNAVCASKSVVPNFDLRRYELIEKLGKGGMGVVYRSSDPALGRDLAIKVMKAEFQNHPAVERRFLREARITGSLQHPNIVAVHNLGRLPDGRLHYTMRLVRGGTFADILKEDAGKSESLPSLLAIFEKVCAAAAYAHSKRVIHRDLKPVNIMVGKFGEVQVMDWGLAKLLTPEGEPAEEEPRWEESGTLIHTEAADTPADLTRSGSGIGTPAYMPPEQALGDWPRVDERADVFALGAILCSMLTGRPPYLGEDGSDVLERAQRGDLGEALARLEQCGADAALTALCRECLAAECSQRPRDAGVVVRRLAEYEAAVEQRLRQAEVERTEAEVRRRERRKRRRLAVILSSAVLLVLLAGMLISTLLALDARHHAEKAEAARGDAVENATIALRQKKVAEDALAREKRLLYARYASQISLALREWQDGKAQLARDLLDGCRWDIRGWEHAYLRHISRDRMEKPWDAVLEHGSTIWCLAISPDGQRVASGGDEKTVKVWEVATGKELLPLKGHEGAVVSVCFSRDGNLLASGSGDKTVKVWEVATGKELLALKGHEGIVRSVCFSPDGKRLASGSEDAAVKVWDVGTGRKLLDLKAHTGPVSSVCFSPDGTRLASGSEDTTVQVWGAATGEKLLEPLRHTQLVSSICFNAEGTWLASGCHDQLVRVWDTANGEQLLALSGHTGAVTSVCFLGADGKRLASGSADQTVRVWDTTMGHELLALKGHTGGVTSLVFSPHGQRLVSGGYDKTVKVWQAATGMEVRSLKGHTGFIRSVCFSADGKQLASGGGDQTVKLWDTVTGEEVLALKKHTGQVWSVCFSPDGKLLASAGKDKTVKVWDTANGRERLSIEKHAGFVRCVCFSPDGQRLASGSDDKTVRVWNAATGQQILNLSAHGGDVISVCFSPDGKRLASGGQDKLVRVWDADSGRKLLDLQGHDGPISSVCFRPDGKRLASSSDDKTIKVWDAATGRNLLTLHGHTDAVISIGFSPDGKWLASGSKDQTVKVWDTATGQELFPLNGHSGVVTGVCFSPDGKHLASSGSKDQLVKLWDLSAVLKP